MIIAFSICSNNYLAQAKTLLDSLELHHPEIKKYIFLVDEMNPQIDYSFFFPAEVVVADQTVIAGFNDLVKKYTVIELNSAIRPFVIQYLADLHPGTNRIFYLDPDMYVYDKLDHLDRLLGTDDIVITPHFLEPVPIDGRTPFENLALNYGVYNLGFLAINPATDNSRKFLNWWGERTREFGYIDVGNGFFVDQIWFNLTPVFFTHVHILTHKGYNMAVWNLHERRIKDYRNDGTIMLDSGENVAIYHFSLWNYNNPTELSLTLNRFNFENRPDLVKLYEDYHRRLKLNRMEEFNKIPCALPVKRIKGRSRIQKALLPGIEWMKKIWRKL